MISCGRLEERWLEKLHPSSSGRMRSALQQMARSAGLERTPSDEEYEAIRHHDPELRAFFKAFKPKVVARVKAGAMPATFQVFNVDRMLREDSTLRHEVGFSLSVGLPTKAMVIPTVWVVTSKGVWIETTDLDLDDTAILFTTKDQQLVQTLESWFQTSRRSTSSQIKCVAMNPCSAFHISLEKFLENRNNLLYTPADPPMRTVKANIAGHTVTMPVPLELVDPDTTTCDLGVEMDSTVESVKADCK